MDEESSCSCNVGYEIRIYESVRSMKTQYNRFISRRFYTHSIHDHLMINDKSENQR